MSQKVQPQFVRIIDSRKDSTETSESLSWIDKLLLVPQDPLELIAIAGATVLIKQGIDWTQTPVPKMVIAFFLNPMATGEQVAYDTLANLVKWIKQRLGLEPPTTPTTPPPLTTQEELMEWLTAFTLAFIIVKHFDAVVGLGNNILGIAKSLILTGVLA